MLKFRNKKEQSKILWVNKEGKASKAGIQEEYLIDTINSVPVNHLTCSEAQTLIENSGDMISLGIFRPTIRDVVVQNDKLPILEIKSVENINKTTNPREEHIANKKSKRVRKRRKKKKQTLASENLLLPVLPVKVIDSEIQSPRIEIFCATPNVQVDELEWIKKNEALLISELETRRLAGSPVQVVVRVEKIVSLRPEYCEILSDSCHLDVIKEDTSNSDEGSESKSIANHHGSLSEILKNSKLEKGNVIKSLVVNKQNQNNKLDLEKLESPSLVKKSDTSQLMDTDFSAKTISPTLIEVSEKVKNISSDEETIKEIECANKELTHNISNCSTINIVQTILNNNNYDMKNYNIDLKNCENVEDVKDEYDNYNEEQQRIISEIFTEKEPISEKSCNKQSILSKNIYIPNKDLNTEYKFNRSQYINFNQHVNSNYRKKHLEQNLQYSSDDSTIKENEVEFIREKSLKMKFGNQHGHLGTETIYDKLKRVALLIQSEDTDDYEDISYRTNSGGGISDVDTDIDWMSYTMSDNGETSKSLCLSPSQQYRAPSNASEASDIIELHKIFTGRAKSPNHNRPTFESIVDILGQVESTKSLVNYSSQVIDMACQLCGISDEPLLDAHRLLSLCKYHDTRSSRLLNAVQQEYRRSDRSAPVTVSTDRLPVITNNNSCNDNNMFIDTFSVPDNRTRELMYAEYMEKVKERENRLNNKVIRITKPGRPLSSSSYGSQLDVDTEFVTKARERLEKLGVDTTDVMFVETRNDSQNDEYPKHLVDIVPEDEVCIEEVKLNGVWSPEVKHKPLDLESISNRRPEKKPLIPSSELPSVWTPNSSPVPERKSYKPVKFESPTLSRKSINKDVQKTPSKPPTNLPVLSSPPPTPSPLFTHKLQGDANANSTERRLPRVQSPTVTLLQKAREGQLPRGSAYLESEETVMNKENKNRGSSSKRNVDPNNLSYSERRDYVCATKEKKQKKMVDVSSKKYEGIGPTTKEGVPIVLKSELKESNQPKWYKQMYESLHKFQTDDDGVIIRYKTLTKEPQTRNLNGYLSEPERGYESYDEAYSIKPVKCSQERYKNQPRPIENYEPGHSSIAEKESKQYWDDAINSFEGNLEKKIPLPHHRSSSKKSHLAQALKESGYDSDSTLIFKKKENSPQCLSPTEQKNAYKVIQSGGEVPFQGLRKAAPERPKDLEMEYLPITSHLTRIHVMKYDNQIFHHPWKEVTCYPVFSTFKRTSRSNASSSVSPPTPPRRESSRKNSRLERWNKEDVAESNFTVKIGKPKSEIEKRSKNPSFKNSNKVTSNELKTEKEKSLRVTLAVSAKGKELKRSATLCEKSSESPIPKRTKSLSLPSKKTTVVLKNKERIPKTILVKSNSSSKRKSNRNEEKSMVKLNVGNVKNEEQQIQFGEEYIQSVSVANEGEKISRVKHIESALKPRESKLDVFLINRKPVSQSKFKTYDNKISMETDWDQFGEHTNNYFKGRSASEPPSRSPSSRRIRSFHTPVKLIESITGIHKCHRSKSVEEPIERARNAAIDYEYQTYVRELRHSGKKSERFKELHNFYCSLERLSELEKTAEKASNKVRKRSDLIDFDKWKTIREKERAEYEIKTIQANLESIQKSKDVLFKIKDPENIRWKKGLDRGLRNRESSVEDLKRKFYVIGNETFRKPEINVYRPLWRGSSVQDVANSLKNTTSSKRGRPVSEDRERSSTSVPRRATSKSVANIGGRIWSSLSMEQLNRLKTQLNEVYSSLSHIKQERCSRSISRIENKKNYEIEVNGRVKKSNMSSSLYVRSSSMGASRKTEEHEQSIKKADSIGSVCLTESEKKKISKCISNEVLEKKKKKYSSNVVIPKETLGAVAAVKSKNTGTECISPRTCYSIDMSEEESTSKNEKNNYVLVLADNENKKQMVSDWANGNNYSESSSSASTVIHLGSKKTTLHSSHSFTSMKSMLGEREVMHKILSPLQDQFYHKSRLVEYGAVRKLCRKFESFDDLRFLHCDSISNENNIIYLKKYRSESELCKNVIRNHEHGDVKNLKIKYEHSKSPVPKYPLRPENRLMPRINVISKLANLQNRLSRGEVDRIRRMFEYKNRAFVLGQFYTSTPDLSEARKMLPFLDCSWLAHKYPEPEPVNRIRVRPKSTSPVRCNRKHHHPSILKQSKNDGFLSQPYNPEAHKPKYRWTPVWNGVWTQQPTLPPKPSVVKFKDSPHKYAESEVTLQYRRPVRNEIKEEWSEEELAIKQAEAMRRIYQEERRRKYLQELQDMSNRRHADNLLPSQKSPIALNRYDDFLDESPQPPRSRTPEPKLVARALYNFIGQTSRELSFRKGDIIFVRKQIDKNWYEGEHNAMVGLFPFNYVEVIPYDGVRTTPHRPYEGQARAKFNFLAQTNMELSLVKGELVVLTRRVDNNWYEGRIGSRKGIFPVSYVTVLVEPGDAPNSSLSAPSKPVASPAAHSLITSNPPNTQHAYQPDSYSSMPSKNNSGTQSKKLTNNNMNETLHVDVHSEPIPYRALYNYKPQNNDELELREGDVVFVMEKCDDGWYVGSSKRTGCFGTFPGNYVQRSV
ncbi:uncharacterized protein LOC126902485 isoform X4 [Daktulosphaira vitifoliae]|uniref:uncharacterized protein LOC126902485 isoform X4 n=1 Tax=Daktulosphaira vitifoliae TaxID=58002 RepID=UPI0021AA03B6|nr:uncharacterized protein LOC126902485 isoform X4 [Daktulosphaira vitifoliae]